MTSRKDLMNEAVDGLFISAGVVGLSMATKKLPDEKLTDASTMKDVFKLAVGVTCSTLLVKYAQENKYIPDNPFKSS